MSVALVADPQPLTSQEQQWLLRAAIDRSADVQEARDYYAGNHPHALTEDLKAALAGLLGGTVDETTGLDSGDRPPVDNQCGRVVEAHRGRLKVRRLDCLDTAVQEAANQFWTLNGLTAQQHSLHTWTLIDGDSYLVLDWSNSRGRTVATANRQWVSDEAAASSTRLAMQYHSRLWVPAPTWPTAPSTTVTGTGVHISYDDNGLPAVAVKEWAEEAWSRAANSAVTIRRRNFYYPDRIERYALLDEAGRPSVHGTWQPYMVAGDPGWPVPWVDPRTGKALGIPVVHFAYNPGADHRGATLIDTVLRGQQRMVNDVLHALLAHMRMRGYGMLAVTGIDQKDVAAWHISPGQVLGTTNQNARIVEIAAADMSGNAVILRFVKEIMLTNASVPALNITGDWPSGEALVQATMPLISAAEVAQQFFGIAYGSAAHKDTVYRNAWGGGEFNTELLITTDWDDAALRDMQYRLAMIGQQNYLSIKGKMRAAGYNEDEVEQNWQELVEERQLGLSGTAAHLRAATPAAGDDSTEEAA